MQTPPFGVARGFVSLAGRGLLSSAAPLALPPLFPNSRLGTSGCRASAGPGRVWAFAVRPTGQPRPPVGLHPSVYDNPLERQSDPAAGFLRELVRRAPRRPGDHRQQRDVHLHLVLAHRRRRPLRPRQHGLLHRRRRGKLHRPVRPLVHPRRHGLQLLRPHGLYRELLPLRPRRRLPRRQGGDGRLPRQAVGVGPDVRLRPDRPDQRRLGRAVRHGHRAAVHQAGLPRRLHRLPPRPARTPDRPARWFSAGAPSSWPSS